MYDNTKFEAAFKSWLETCVEIGFGEHYAGDLLNDFCDHCAKHGLLKRSPGRVVFGKELGKYDFDKRKRMGLTYWSGLRLLNPPEEDALAPKRYARTKDAEEEIYRQRKEIEAQEEYENSEETGAAKLAAFRAELEAERRETIEKVGEE